QPGAVRQLVGADVHETASERSHHAHGREAADLSRRRGVRPDPDPGWPGGVGGVDSADPLIVKVLRSYDKAWKPPADRGRKWTPCLCPFHDDENPSASINFRDNAFTCHGCGEKGNAISIIMRKEGLSYRQAVQYAEELSPGSNARLREEHARKPRRRVFGQREEADGYRGVSPGVRRRTTPWS